MYDYRWLCCETSHPTKNTNCISPQDGRIILSIKKPTYNFQLCGSKSDPQGIPTYMASIQSVVSAAAVEIKVLKVL